MKLIDLTNQKFSRLLVLSRKNNKWECLCDCGNIKYVNSQNLKNGGTKSCGCFNKDRIKNIPKTFTNKKYTNEISLARRCWKNKYSDANLTFDQFYKLSKQNCHYCNDLPKQIFKYDNLKYKFKDQFIYNGIDRLDSSKSHTITNCVTSCYTCNRFKSNLPINDFINKINNIFYKDFTKHNKNIYSLNKYQLTNLKIIWTKTYNKELDFDFFVSITRENCFYCNQSPNNYIHYQCSNKYSELARSSGGVYYSGLDRYDNSINHVESNVVPCCKYCNFAKSDMNVVDFFNHINKIKINLNENKQINNTRIK